MEASIPPRESRVVRQFSFFRGNLIVLALSGAFTSFGAGMIGVYMPKYFLTLGGNTLTLGLIGTTGFAIQFLMLLLGGFAADHYGRRKILVITAVYGTFFPLFYFLVQDWPLIALISIIVVFGSVSGPASHAIVVDSLSPEKRTTGIATLQVISSLPQIIAPFIWGWLIETMGWINGFKAGCLYSVGATIISTFIIAVFLKETLKKPKKPDATVTKNDNLRGLNEIRRSLSPSLKALIVAYALVMFANGAVGQYYIIYAIDVIKLTVIQWSIIVSLQFLAASILRIPGAWASEKLGKRNVLIISVLSCAPFAIFFTLSQSFLPALIMAVLLVVTGIYYAPVHEALQADLTPRPLRGRIISIWSLGGALGAASGPIVGGWLFHVVYPTVPFYLFTVAELVAALILIVGVREPSKREE